ncbi:MAG: flagellin [Pseudohongiellaceae bacterium]|nr:flagellin [Pseudohongiellaceae bacterium]
MAQIINSNIASLNAQRNLNSSQAGTNQALERLSSGLRINSAKDDAAGLAISTRFQSQINGLNVAIRNVGDGVSLAQTAEGALGSMTESMQRIRELALQSANGTNSADDRAALNAEAQQLIAEVSRAGSQTNFNGLNLLDGSFSSVFQVGANAGETIGVSIGQLTADTLGVSDSSGVSSTATSEALSNGALTINGVSVGATRASDDTASTSGQSTSAIAKAAAINRVSDESGVTAIVDENTVAGTSITTGAASGTVTVNGTEISIDTTGDGASTRAAVVTAINAESELTGVTAVDSGEDSQGVTLVAADGRNVVLSFGGALTADNTGLAAAGTHTGGFTLVADSDVSTITIAGSDAESAGLVSGSFSAGVATVSSTARSATGAAAATAAVAVAGSVDQTGALAAYDYSAGTAAVFAEVAGGVQLSATGTNFTSEVDAAVTGSGVNATTFAQNFTDNGVQAEVFGSVDLAATGTDFDNGGANNVSFRLTVVDDANYDVQITADYTDATVGGGAGSGNVALLNDINTQIAGSGFTASLTDGAGGAGTKLTFTQDTASAQTATITAQFDAADAEVAFGFTTGDDYDTGSADTAVAGFTITTETGVDTITLDSDVTAGNLASAINTAIAAAGNNSGAVASIVNDNLVITTGTDGSAGTIQLSAFTGALATDPASIIGIDDSDGLVTGTDSNSVSFTINGGTTISLNSDYTDATVGGGAGSGNTALLSAIQGVLDGDGTAVTVSLSDNNELVFTEDVAGGAGVTFADDIQAGDVDSLGVLGIGDGATATGSAAVDTTNVTFDVYVDGGLVQNVDINDNIADDTALLAEINGQLTGLTASLSDDGYLQFTSDTTGATSQVQIANIAGDAASIAQLGLTAQDETGTAAVASDYADLDSGDLVINGTSISAAKATDDTASYADASSSSKAASGISIAAAINSSSGTTGVTATVNATEVEGSTAATAGTEGNTGTLYINGVDISLTVQDSADNNRTAAVSAINAVSGQTGVVAEDNGSSLTLTAADGRNVVLAFDTQGGAAAANFGLGNTAESDFSDGGSTGITRANEDATTTYSTVTLSSAGAIEVSGGTNGNSAIAELGIEKGTFGGGESGQFLSEIDISTQEGANAALEAIDNALNSVNSARADLGAIQNRFETTISNLALTSENLSAANSRIKDADFAAEAAALSRSQVLQQAGISILSQANAAPQQVLSLLQ